MSDTVHKILIAEDDPFLSKIMKNRLTEEGFEVDHAADGEEAIEMLSKTDYSVAMLDLIMPAKTGFDVLKALRDTGSKTPALVFTNLAQDEDRKEVLALGAQGYYVKSDIAVDDMVDTIKNFVKS